jgi:hypothetical protein
MFTQRSMNYARSLFCCGTDVVSERLHADSQRANLSIPEKALMFAVLADAVDTYQQSAFSDSPRKRHLFHEAEEWFCREEADYLFSFKGICEALGFDPAFLRRGLILWTAKCQENRVPRTRLQVHSVRSPRRKRTRQTPRTAAREFRPELRSS